MKPKAPTSSLPEVLHRKFMIALTTFRKCQKRSVALVEAIGESLATYPKVKDLCKIARRAMGRKLATFQSACEADGEVGPATRRKAMSKSALSRYY